LDSDPNNVTNCSHHFSELIQANPDITHGLLLFSVAQGIFWLSSKRISHSTLHLTEWERGVFILVLYVLATVMSCIDPSARTVKKSPTEGPILLYSIFSISLESAACLGSAAIVEDQLGLLVEERGLGRHEPVHHRELSIKNMILTR
jgi:hypothetical protein